MGFLSSIKKAVGSAVSKVGEIFNSSKLASIGASLEGRRSKVVETVGVSKSFNPQKNSFQETKRANDALAEYAVSVKEDTSSLEFAISSALDELHSVVEEMSTNKIIRNRLNLDYQDARTKAKAVFSDYISKHMTTANEECAEIMKMRPSKKKADAMNRFSKRISREASDAAKESIKDMLYEQNYQLKKEYEQRSKDELSLLTQNKEELDRIKQQRTSLSSEKDISQAKYQQIIHEATTIKRLLGVENESNISQFIPDGIYAIVPVEDNNYSLSIECNAQTSGAKVHLWKTQANNPFSQFQIRFLNNGYYELKNNGSSLVMDVINASRQIGTRVQQFASNNSNAQQWQIASAGDNTFYIYSRCNQLAITLPKDETISNGTAAIMGICGQTQKAKWILKYIKPLSSGTEIETTATDDTNLEDIARNLFPNLLANSN